MSHHKEEGRSRIIEDVKDREQIRNFLSMCRHPFGSENHAAKFVNIHTGKLLNKDTNVDKCVEIGSEQVKEFYQTLPEGFYDSLSKQVKTMSILQKSG